MKKIIMITFLLFINCKSDKKVAKEYYDIEKYIDNISLNRTENQLFVFLTTDSCSGCVKEIINVLNTVSKYNAIKIIAIGDTKKETINLIKNISYLYSVYYDFKGKGFCLINSNSNMLITIKSKKIDSKLNFTIDNISDAINKIITYEN